MTVDIDITQQFEDNNLIKFGEIEFDSKLMRHMPLIDIICISIRKLRETHSEEMDQEESQSPYEYKDVMKGYIKSNN